MIYLYGQNVAVCALAVSLLLAGTITFLLPKDCDLSPGNADNTGTPCAEPKRT